MITLVLGGTRSGKSEVAERLARRAGSPVTYVATGQVTDPEMAERIEAHRRRRPADWSTIEVGHDLPEVLRGLSGVVLVDSLGTWVAGFEDLEVDPAPLCDALRAMPGSSMLVSEEVGLGVHAPTALGRRFADTLGTVNRAVADVADTVLLVVAGKVLPLQDSYE